MSAIDELIAEFCPDGVEYHRFSDVCTLKARVGWQRLTKAEQMPTGDYMLVTGTDFTPSNEVDYSTCSYVSKNRYDQDENIQLKNGDVLITKDGTLGKVAVVGNLPKPATLNGGVFVVRSKDGKLDNRYIAHYLQSSYFKRAVDSQKTGSTISHLTQGLFSRLEIPVPPIEVQREIVRILDAFAALTDELTAKLAEEVAARKQQYAHYRDRLLSRESLEALDGEPVEMKTMGELFEMKAGAHISSTMISDDMDSPHLIPCYGGNGIRGYVENANQSGIALLIGRQGALCGNVCLASGEFYATEHAVVTKCRQVLILPNYAFHMLTNRDLNQYKSAGAQPGLAVGKLKVVEFPVPSLATQQKVIDILDRFDALTSSLTDGLPAEIEARRTQYEYYRDRLLDFPRKEVAAS